MSLPHKCSDCGIKDVNHPSHAFCGGKDGCAKKRMNDLIEVIHMKDGELVVDRYQSWSVAEAEEFLKSRSAIVRIDLHNVLDLIDDHTKKIVSDSSKMAGCSYVGTTTRTRADAHDDFKRRILSGQLGWGVLVFKRGKHGKPDAHSFQEVGSKAWFNRNVQFDERAIFLDDSDDHVDSVESLGIKGLRTHLVKDLKDLMNVLKDF